MRSDFFANLSRLAELAADPETAAATTATLEYCAAELGAMAERAEQRSTQFWRLREDAWLVVSREEQPDAERFRVWLETAGRRRMVLDTQDAGQAEQVTAAMRQVVE